MGNMVLLFMRNGRYGLIFHEKTIHHTIFKYTGQLQNYASLLGSFSQRKKIIFRDLTRNFREITQKIRELTRKIRELTRNNREKTRNFCELTRNFRKIT